MEGLVPEEEEFEASMGLNRELVKLFLDGGDVLPLSGGETKKRAASVNKSGGDGRVNEYFSWSEVDFFIKK